MSSLQVQCTLTYNTKKNRLYAVCGVGIKGIVVSAADHEVINHPDSVVKDLVLSAVNETDQFESYMMVAPSIEVLDPCTMRFLLDSKVEVPHIIYHKCDNCYGHVADFIDSVLK